MSEVTELLSQWYEEEPKAREELFELVYQHLREIAARRLSGERRNHTLPATALVHEAYLRLCQLESLQWKNREHFFAIASQAMRRILLDHARGRLAARRGSGQIHLPLEDALFLATERPAEYVRLDEALTELAAFDPEKAQIVELRYFAGLTLPETATVVGLSRATVARHWRIAMGWLHQALTAEPVHAG